MKFYLQVTFWILTILLLLCIGCTETQLQRADAVIEDVNGIASTMQEILELPTIKVIPHPYILISSTLIGLILGGVKVWERIRKSKQGY